MTVRSPLVGTIRHFIAAREIVTERVLRLHEDLFLGHHLLLRGAAGVKPLSHCFPVMPLSVVMESMAEVAGCLAPGYGIIGFEKVEALRWVGMRETDTLSLRTSARMRDHDAATDTRRIEVEIFSAGDDGANARGTVLFGRRYQRALNLAFPEPRNPTPYPLSGAEIYGQGHLFHGPIFQTLTGQPMLAEDAVRGDLSVLAKNGMFRSTPKPRMLTDPLLLDGASQLLGLWSLHRGFSAYPVGVRKIEFYCSPPGTGLTVPSYVRVTRHTHRLLEGDMEIQDGAGHVWLRARGWKKWLSRLSDDALRFVRAPTRHCLSRELSRLHPSREVVSQIVEKDDLGGLEPWILAGYYLHLDEMTRFHDPARSPEEQLQWLLGRVAGKDAVRRCLAPGADSEMLHPASFSIDDRDDGPPVVQNLPESRVVPGITVTHAQGRAVCVARIESANGA